MKDTNTTVTGNFFFFFFFHLESKFASRCFEERCSKTEVSSAKEQQYQSYRNIFFFHSESKFASRCFEQRCSKAEVPSAKKLQEHFSFSFEANICVLVF